MGVGGQLHTPAALPPGIRPGIHCIGGWVDPRAGLDMCGKSRPPPGFDPRTVQPVASRYTDYASPVLSSQCRLAQAVKLLTCFQEVPGKNFGLGISCPL
jgi:hypothetical protein